MTSHSPGGTATATPPAGRLVWADAGKGVCIVLVVLHHTIGKQYELVVPENHQWLLASWEAVTSGLKPLRMPLFFVLSGMFASAALQRPWRDVMGPRVLSPYYLYVVWLCIHAALFSWATTLPMNRTRNLEELLADLAYASTSLWYLYALALYFPLAKVLHRFDPRVVVALAAAAVPLSELLDIEAYNRESVIQHFVYFAFGACFPTVGGRVADVTRRGRWTAALLAAYLVVGGLLLLLGASRGVLTLSLSLFAVPLGIGATVFVTRRIAWLGRAAATVGRATLPVYVLHVPLLAVVHRLGFAPPDWDRAAGLSLLLAAIYPVALAVAITAVALAIHRLLAGGPLRWLFARPGLNPRRPAPTAPRRPDAPS